MLKGPKKSEHNVHKNVCKLLREQWPKVRFYTSLDGFDLGQQRSLTGSLKWYDAEHDGSGFPDLMVFKRNRKHPFLVLELKKEGVKTTRKSKHLNKQRDWLEYFRSMGAKAEFASGYDEAVDIIKQYMRLT